MLLFMFFSPESLPSFTDSYWCGGTGSCWEGRLFLNAAAVVLILEMICVLTNILYLFIVYLSFTEDAEQLFLYRVSFCLITANGEYPGGHWGKDRTLLFSQRKNCLFSACSHSLNTGHGRGHFSNAPPPSSYHQGNYPLPRGGGHQPFQRKTHARTNTP